MAVLPEVIPISDLRARQNEILARLGQGPVVLTQHGRAAAVLISPETWNNLMEALEDLQDAIEGAQAYEEWKRDPSTGRPWEEIRAELVAEGLLDE
jgi:antitoxin Phd